jgi:hypothetical protein
MERPSVLEQLFPTRIARWGLLAMLSAPAVGYGAMQAVLTIWSTADPWHKILLWLVATLLLAFASAFVVILDLAVILKAKDQGVIWHHKPAKTKNAASGD